MEAVARGAPPGAPRLLNGAALASGAAVLPGAAAVPRAVEPGLATAAGAGAAAEGAAVGAGVATAGAATPPVPSSSFSPSPVSSLSSEPQSFESLTRAAVCGRLRSLALMNCCGLGEGLLVRLLRACGMLEDLRVEGSDGFSDTVIAGSKLEVLTRLTVVGCGGITADSIGGLLGNVPRLRFLKVEASKVSERARRELLRAGVVVRGA
ncbi:unnamed protein product [Closterium sp. NIES-64]|nr:unnamed protein product [Closterium sp. NIES-64]